jgi:hypothetical protein
MIGVLKMPAMSSILRRCRLHTDAATALVPLAPWADAPVRPGASLFEHAARNARAQGRANRCRVARVIGL